MFRISDHSLRQAALATIALASVLAVGIGCNNSASPPGGAGGESNGGNTPVNIASGYNGSLSGKVADQQTTRASTVDASTAQEVPPIFDTQRVIVDFRDVAGGRLVDQKGNVIPAAVVTGGVFSAEGLPVGVDFTLCVDIGEDGTCDMQSFVNIPNDNPNAPGTGHVDGAQTDPLTTLVLAKLRALMEERGIDPANLPISPVALVSRIVDAYIHLFEESGVDAQVTLDEIQSLDEAQLAALFDEVIPSLAQAGMLTARGSLGLANAADVNAAALAAAEVFLQAGFPIADGPDPLDLSSLGNLPDVEITTPSALFAMGNPLTDDFTKSGEEIPPAQALPGGNGMEPTVYYSTVAEPDRNFSDEESNADAPPGPRLPMINDHLLLQMARMQLEKRQITLADVHELLTSIDDGIGARLTYFVFDPTVSGPPATVFETSDGAGKAIHMQEVFARISAGGFQQMSPEELQQRDADLRTLLRDLLSGTVAPSLETVAGALMTDRVGSVDELASKVREAMIHLPMSRTGSSTFFVVADGDSFRSATTVSPVTVDAVVSANGVVSSVAYNASGEGKFYLMCTEGTEGEGIVGLLVREAGRPLHGPHGPLRLNMHDETIFAPVNGAPFVDFVSDTGSFFPGVNVSIVSSSFVPEATDPNAADPAAGGPSGPNQQMFVLASAPTPGAEPVHVEYDTATGIATYNPTGRFLLQFIPETQDTGVFMLFNESTGRPAGQEDPTTFFAAPPPPPGGTMPPSDGTSPPPDGGMPPPDGTMPPPDGGMPPPDGALPPPPDGNVVPPGGDVPPAQDVGVPTDSTAGTDPTSGGAPPPTDGAPPPDGNMPPPPGGPMPPPSLITVSFDNIVGLPIGRETFTHVFGVEVPNPRYNPDGDPYFDDINGNGVQDADEPTTPFRPALFKTDDWRSTDIRMYYRRGDTNAAVTFEDVAFDAQTPQTRDGAPLVPRVLLPRLNAFRFGRPNSALTLLTTFLPPEFFDGAHAFDASTQLDVFGAVAVMNLMMDQSQNVQAIVDIDGPGPLTSQNTLIDAHIFVPPVGDPFMLLLKGFEARSQVVAPTNTKTTDSGTAQ